MTIDRPNADDGPDGALGETAGVGGMDGEQVDAIHHALADRCRRETLRYLAGVEARVVPVADIADHVHDRGLGTDAAAVAIRLHHVTLPTLAETDFLAYDSAADVVAYSSEPALERKLREAGPAADD